MPWSNQNGGGGGGWKGGGGGPWGQGPSGGGSPDLEDMLKRGQDRLKQAMPGGSGMSGGFIAVLVLIVLVFFGAYASIVVIDADEQGVVLRFGRFARQIDPGPHLRWPYPIEEVYKPNVKRINPVEITGTVPSNSSPFSRSSSRSSNENLIITGDENIVHVKFNLQWVIKDAPFYVFHIEDPEGTVRNVAESTMRDVIGQNDFTDAITKAREKIAVAVKKQMQRVLDDYKSGILINKVQVDKVVPPAAVNDAFLEVQNAKADQQRLVNEADADAKRVVPVARGAAQKILQEAEAYKEQAVAEAKGRTGRFLKVYEQYAKAPEVTRKRMFLETMERVLKDTQKIIIDDKNTGVVPYLPLNELGRKKSGGQ
jgi:membrane protease subunit HflK